MINLDTLLSSFNDKETLMTWLIKVEKALENSTLTSVEAVSSGAGAVVFKFNFADGTNVTSDPIPLAAGPQGPQGPIGPQGPKGDATINVTSALNTFEGSTYVNVNQSASGDKVTIKLDETMVTAESDDIVSNNDKRIPLASCFVNFLYYTHTWKDTQTFNVPNSYVDTTGHNLISLFDMNVMMQEAPQTYKIGQLTIADDSTHENYIERYDLFLYKNQQSKHILLDNGSVGKGLEYVAASNRVNVSHPVVQITQAAYDALTTKDSATLYVIVG